MVVYEFETLRRTVDSKYIFQPIAKRRLSDIYHSHNFYEWIIVLNGTCVQRLNMCDMEMHKNDCVLLCPGDFHSFVRQSSDTNIISMSVEKDEVRRFEELFGLKEKPLGFFRGRLNQNQIKTVSDFYYATKEYEYKLLFSNLISIYIESFVKKDNIPVSIKNVMQQMNNPENLKAGADRFAELSQYSRSHLSRLMKQHFDMTIHEYILKTRLESAYNSLILSDIKPELISESLGYESFSHFSKIFKEKYGMTPAEVRKKYRIWTI